MMFTKETCKVEFEIKHPEFLVCFADIIKTKEINLYRHVEAALFGKLPKGVIFEYKLKLKNSFEDFMCYLRKHVETHTHIKKSNNEIEDTTQKRKNIKESMIENYVIKNNLTEEHLKKINIKLFLKTLNPKNIVVDLEQIVDILE